MTYTRVMPRDLFNEAKLLKCLGQLALAVHDGADLRRQATPSNLKVEFDGERFDIEQDESCGDLHCPSVRVSVAGSLVFVASRYNDKSPYPLMFGDDGEPVFDADGSFSMEFLTFCEGWRK